MMRTKKKPKKGNVATIRPKDYIRKFRAFIKVRLEGSGLLPSVVMAHALYEAADDNRMPGNSTHSKVYHNDVRLLADKSWRGPKVRLPLRNPVGTSSRNRKAAFRVYTAPEHAIADRITMLTASNHPWPKMFMHHDTLQAQAVLLQLSIASNDPRYAERLVSIVAKHKLHWMDRQWMIEKLCRIVIRMVLLSAFGHVLHRHWDDLVPWR